MTRQVVLSVHSCFTQGGWSVKASLELVPLPTRTMPHEQTKFVPLCMAYLFLRLPDHAEMTAPATAYC